MTFHIMGWRQALSFVPQKPTLAIRILDPETTSDNSKNRSQRLQISPRYLAIYSFQFNDIDPRHFLQFAPRERTIYEQLYPEPFTRKQAADIIAIYPRFSRTYQTMDVLIHCHLGESRSPAVGLALAERYGLLDEAFRLREEYPIYNRYVYDTMKDIRQ